MPVSPDMEDWIEDCFDWFDGFFGPADNLILPTAKFFTAEAGADNDTATTVVRDIERLMGMEAALDVMPLGMLPEEYRHTYQSNASIAGTFEAEGVVRYDPALLKTPTRFIGVMAHEVMHARLHGFEANIPGGIEAHELATDLGCVIAGFGIFQLQAADDAGWSGYMSQSSRAFALARFLKRRNQTAEEAMSYLSPRCKRLLRKAMRASV